MCELILRQATIDEIDGVDWYHQNKNGEMVHGANSKEHQPWYKSQDIYKALKAVPAVDAVPVVRCGECKHMTADGRCLEFADDCLRPSASDFCSRGERRTDE